MALFISFKEKRTKDTDFIRFNTAFYIFSTLFDNFKIEKNSILIYKYDPLPELNENDFIRQPYEFGLLETTIRRKIDGLSKESIYLGFELESTFNIQNKNFTLIFTLLPSYKQKHYDIKIEIVPNGYAEILEDL